MKNLTEILKYLAVIVAAGSLAYVFRTVWMNQPWFRRYPKPRKMVQDAKDQIRAYKLRKTCEAAFDPSDPLYVPIQVQQPRLSPDEIEAIAIAVAGKVSAPPALAATEPREREAP